MRLSFYYPPARFFYALKKFNSELRILDIGCDNQSPEITKRWFPKSIYHGIDIKQIKSDKIDKFFLVKANDYRVYDLVNDDFYDFIILNHVIEHIKNPSKLLDIVSKKLKPGGILWIAFPSPKSLNFPSGIGTLNFSDDPSHITICSYIELSNKLMNNGLKIIYAGKSKDFIRFMLGLFVYPLAFITKLIYKKYMISGLWYLFGFEDRIICFKPED